MVACAHRNAAVQPGALCAGSESAVTDHQASRAARARQTSVRVPGPADPIAAAPAPAAAAATRAAPTAGAAQIIGAHLAHKCLRRPFHAAWAAGGPAASREHVRVTQLPPHHPKCQRDHQSNGRITNRLSHPWLKLQGREQTLEPAGIRTRRRLILPQQRAQPGLEALPPGLRRTLDAQCADDRGERIDARRIETRFAGIELLQIGELSERQRIETTAPFLADLLRQSKRRQRLRHTRAKCFDQLQPPEMLPRRCMPSCLWPSPLHSSAALERRDRAAISRRGVRFCWYLRCARRALPVR